MLTKQEVKDFETYCRENKIPKKLGLKNRGITYYNYYKSKNTYILQEQQASSLNNQGSFIPLSFTKDISPKTQTRSRRGNYRAK